MREFLPRILARNALFLGVVCQRRANVERFFAQDPLPFPLVIDEDRSIAKRWGVYHRLGLDAIHIAHPATFLIDGGGRVRLAEIAPNQFQRYPLSEVIDRLEALTPAG